MDNIKRKIMALLNLSTGRGATEAEMQTAMSMAMKLAARHRYNISDLKEESIKAEEQENFVKAEFRTAEGETRRPPCHRQISNIIRRFFAVEIILLMADIPRKNGTWAHGSKVMMIGRESDVEFAKFVYNYLRTTFNRLWSEIKKQQGLPQSERAEYFEGLYSGLCHKLYVEKKMEESHIAKIKQITDQSFALVVVNEADKLKRATEDLSGGTSPVRMKLRNLTYGNTYESGKIDGSKININRGLNNRKEQIK